MSVNLVLRPVRKEPENAYLSIRTYYGGKSTFKSLGFKIKRKNLKKNGIEVSTAEPQYKEINKKIREGLSDIYSKGAENVVEEVKLPKNLVMPYVENIISDTANEGTRKSRVSAKNKFEEFLAEEDITNLQFKNLTPQLFNKFRTYMLRRGYKQNSANAYIQTFKLFVNYAKKDDKLKLPDSFDPFKGINLTRNKIKNKSLTKEELELFAHKTWKKDKYNLYKEMFMFQLYGGALRVSDILTLRWSNLSVIEEEVVLDYRMFKTKQHMSSTLFTNGLAYLNLPFNELFPDFIETFEELNTDLERLNKEHTEIEMKIVMEEDGFDPIHVIKQLSAGEPVDISSTLARDKKITELTYKRADLIKAIEEKKKAILNHYKDHIKLANQSYSDRFIFPFMWNEKKNEPFIDLSHDVVNKVEYRKLNNERSKYDGHLKRMGELLEIKTTISSHVSRHTFTQLLMESNVNIHYISIALGHTDIAITNKYRRTLRNKDALGISSKLPQF